MLLLKLSCSILSIVSWYEMSIQKYKNKPKIYMCHTHICHTCTCPWHIYLLVWPCTWCNRKHTIIVLGLCFANDSWTTQCLPSQGNYIVVGLCVDHWLLTHWSVLKCTADRMILLSCLETMLSNAHPNSTQMSNDNIYVFWYTGLPYTRIHARSRPQERQFHVWPNPNDLEIVQCILYTRSACIDIYVITDWLYGFLGMSYQFCWYVSKHLSTWNRSLFTKSSANVYVPVSKPLYCCASRQYGWPYAAKSNTEKDELLFGNMCWLWLIYTKNGI